MANSITAFMERVTAASGEFNAAKVGALSLIDIVYKDVRPEVARNGQTIRIPFPDTGAWSDQAANDWNPTDVNPGYVDVAFGMRPGNAILIRDFEQWQTSSDIINTFLDPMFKRGQEFINGSIAGLLTTANFNAYAPLVSPTLATVPIGTARVAWDILTTNRVPTSDVENMALAVHSNNHANMLLDTQWYQENLVGAVIAQQTRTNAATTGPANVAFNFTRRYDQQIPTALTANLTGTLATTNLSNVVTGTGTAFTSQAVAGTYLTIGSDTVAYRVEAVTSDTALTLSQAYGGTTGSNKNFKRTTYTNVAMHKFAAALALRPLELVNQGEIIQSRLVMLKGIPFRVMLSYQHLKGGYLLTMDTGCAVAVLRPDFGIVIQS